MMKNMVGASSQLRSTKGKLVNHSTRKHLVQNLVDSNVPPTEIAQITGQKNINSINNSSALSNKKQQQISAILCTAPASKENASQIMEIDEVCMTTAKAVQPASHANNLAVFNNCQIGTVNVFAQGQSTVGEANFDSVDGRTTLKWPSTSLISFLSLSI